MVKNYKQFNESLRDLMVGPTEEEYLNSIVHLPNATILKKSLALGIESGIRYGLERYRNGNINNQINVDDLSKFNDMRWFDILMEYKIVPPYDVIFKFLKNGDFNIVKKLIDNGFDMGNLNRKCDIFDYACEKNRFDIAKLLIDNGLKMDSYELLTAIDSGNYQILNMVLLEIDSDKRTSFINFLFDKNYDYIEERLIKTGHYDMVDLLRNYLR